MTLSVAERLTLQHVHPLEPVYTPPMQTDTCGASPSPSAAARKKSSAFGLKSAATRPLLSYSSPQVEIPSADTNCSVTLPMPGTDRTGSVRTNAVTAAREGARMNWPSGLLMSEATWGGGGVGW